MEEISINRYCYKVKKNLKIPSVLLLIFVIFLVSKLYSKKQEQIVFSTASNSDEIDTESLETSVLDNVNLLKFRYPDRKDLKRLQQNQIALENATDPLPESTYCQRDVFLLILVISQPSSFKRRDNIRDSWAFSYEDDYTKLKNRKVFPNKKTYLPRDVVKTVFVIGRLSFIDKDAEMTLKLRDESRLSKDLVFGNVIENYRNLTLKTKLALKWAVYGCKSTFVIKTDDDVFINPVVLVEWLKGMPQQDFYSGSCNFNSPVIRDKNEKWYISKEDYKESRLPGYCVGGGYLLSEDLLLKVVKKSYGRKIFPMEDVYVGLMVKELGVQPRDEKKHFDVGYEENIVLNKCSMNNLFLAHRVVGKNLFKLIKQARFALDSCW